MEISDHTQRYWQYEYDVAAKYMIPLLEHWNVPLQGTTMIDVGCGEGGGVCAMYDNGMQCFGFDIEEHRIAMAKLLQGERSIQWAVSNLFNNECPFSGGEYGLVVLHDVFEHLDRKQDVLEMLKRYMKPNGRLMITFPPYFSAYGAHQQLLNASWLKIPFIHLVPFAITKILPRVRHESPRIVEEVQRLGTLRMGMAKFEQIVKRGGMGIVGQQAYIISPNHIRFGLKPIPAGPVADIPLLREIVCTGVVYLLTKQ